jgi:hypothetical protein
MTLIAYANKTIYADTVTVSNVVGNPVIEHNQKLFKSQCGFFAYAAVGALMSKVERDFFEREFLKSAILRKESDFHIVPSMEIQTKLLAADRKILVMSSDSVLTLSFKSVEIHNVDHAFSYGSGTYSFDFAHSLLEQPVSLAKMRRLYLDVSKVQPMCGPLAHHIRMKDLAPASELNKLARDFRK